MSASSHRRIWIAVASFSFKSSTSLMSHSRLLRTITKLARKFVATRA
jgi:hypothetical protein